MVKNQSRNMESTKIFVVFFVFLNFRAFVIKDLFLSLFIWKIFNNTWHAYPVKCTSVPYRTISQDVFVFAS